MFLESRLKYEQQRDVAGGSVFLQRYSYKLRNVSIAGQRCIEYTVSEWNSLLEFKWHLSSLIEFQPDRYRSVFRAYEQGHSFVSTDDDENIFEAVDFLRATTFNFNFRETFERLEEPRMEFHEISDGIKEICSKIRSPDPSDVGSSRLILDLDRAKQELRENFGAMDSELIFLRLL